MTHPAGKYRFTQALDFLVAGRGEMQKRRGAKNVRPAVASVLDDVDQERVIAAVSIDEIEFVEPTLDEPADGRLRQLLCELQIPDRVESLEPKANSPRSYTRLTEQTQLHPTGSTTTF